MDRRAFVAGAAALLAAPLAAEAQQIKTRRPHDPDGPHGTNPSSFR
jgi:hypothetical protein